MYFMLYYSNLADLYGFMVNGVKVYPYTYIRQFDPTQPKIKSCSKNIRKNKKPIVKITKNTQQPVI
jgi:hypothetical protein